MIAAMMNKAYGVTADEFRSMAAIVTQDNANAGPRR